jgi:hypothetical protein
MKESKSVTATPVAARSVVRESALALLLLFLMLVLSGCSPDAPARSADPVWPRMQ